MAFARHTDLLSKRLLEINAQVVADFGISQLNIKEKTLATPQLKTTWLMIYLEEKKFMKKLKEALAAKVDEYMSVHGREGIPKRKTEDEALKSADLQKLRKAISEQDEVIEFLEGVVKISSGFNFDIKNSIDIIKIESA